MKVGSALTLLIVLLSVPAAGDEIRADATDEALSFLDLSHSGLRGVRKHVQAGDEDGALHELLKYSRQRTQPRWYWSRDDVPGITAYIKERMATGYQSVIASADEICRHRFPNSTAPTIVKRIQLPKDFSWTDNPTDDPQFPYMMNRHKFWEELGTAYLLTGDEKYAKEWISQLASWLDAAPTSVDELEGGRHPMWWPLDVGIRAKKWAWTYFCFRDSPALTPELHARWLSSFAEHARFLKARHAKVWSNWCVMQMEGLLCVALTFPEFKGAETWRDYAVQTLVKAQRTQILPDGVQVEQSPSYHMGCVRWFYEPMRLGELNGVVWPTDYRERLERMCEFALWMMGPDGRTVALSDSDRDRHSRNVLATGAMAFHREDFAPYAMPAVRQVWLEGVDAVRRLGAVKGKQLAETVRHFPDAGYVVMRSGWDREASYTVFDCGPRGGGHGHFDLLSLEIHAFGQLMLADPGRWLYDRSALRAEMLSTPAHNTISLDGHSHKGAEAKDSGYEILDVSREGDWTHVHGRHDLYTQFDGPPVCERRVFFNGRLTWLVVDEMTSPEPHDIAVSWLFASPSVRRVSNVLVATPAAAGPLLLILHEAGLASAELEPATLSRVYSQKEPAVRLRLRRHGRTARIVSVIHAFEGPTVPACSLRLIEDPLEMRVGVEGENSRISMGRDGDWRVETPSRPAP
jgi:hypothetical protein